MLRLQSKSELGILGTSIPPRTELIFPIEILIGGHIMSMDFLPTAYVAMLNGVVVVNSTTPTAVRVGSTNLRSRKWLVIQSAVAGTTKVFIGSSSTEGTDITKAILAKAGIKIGDGQVLWLPVSDFITVYAISSTGAGKRLRVAELA